MTLPLLDRPAPVRGPNQKTINAGAIKTLDGAKKLAEKLLTDGKPAGYDIETGYDGPKMTEISDLFPHLKGKALKCLRFNTLDLTSDVIAYACDDAAWALADHEVLYPRVTGKDRKFIFDIDMAIMEILCDVEDEGIEIDWPFLREADQRAKSFNTKQHKEILAELSALTGRPISININSSPQLGKVLFEELGYKSVRKTKGGAPSTDAVAMEALSKKYPVVKQILEWREVQALDVRYLEKWPREYSGNKKDGRAHPNVNQTAVGTGRFAVSDPSVQQCPKRRPYKLKSGETFVVNFRDCIKAPEGYYILDFDYSQVELRVMAGLSKEQALIDAFNHGDDVHTITAAMMLGVPRDAVDKDMRAVGKTMNFALLYGMGVNSLSDRLAISKERAQELYNAYFSGFSSITTWMEREKRVGKKRGYTISKFGRKYTIWELQSDNRAIYSKGERVCVNAPVQGGAADYMKVAMVRTYRKLKKAGLWRNGVHMVMNNHDALTFYVRNDITPKAAIELLRPAVEYPVEGFPRIEAEFSIGPRWGSMEDADENSEFRFEEGEWQVKCKKCEEWSVHECSGHAPEPVGAAIEAALDRAATADVETDTQSKPFLAPGDQIDRAMDGRSDEELERDASYEVKSSDLSDGAGRVAQAAEDKWTAIDEQARRAALPSEHKDETGNGRQQLGELRDSAASVTSRFPTAEGKKIIIDLPDMPSQQQMGAILRLIADSPGPNPYEIHMPEGPASGHLGTSLAPADESKISMIMPNARLYHPASEIGADAFDDIEL
jgi:DNA polymerase I-like protein with 3'-5' exonuclease and polymerase domains